MQLLDVKGSEKLFIFHLFIHKLYVSCYFKCWYCRTLVKMSL